MFSYFKSLLLLSVIWLASIAGLANDDVSVSQNQEGNGNIVAYIEYTLGDKLCIENSKLAGTIMTHRQNGVPLTKLIELTESQKYKLMAIKAFLIPLYSSTSDKEKASTEFSSQYYLACHEELVTKLEDKYGNK